VAEQVSVLLFVLGLLYGVTWLCHHIAWWSMRTPRSGYLILSIFALFILTRSMP
jgi:hypothetical protein